MHEEIMIVASEAVLPLGITAVFASRGRTSVAHAHWGYYLIAAVALQIFTGWLRTKGLEAKQSNFSFLHRVSHKCAQEDGEYKYKYRYLGRTARMYDEQFRAATVCVFDGVIAR